MSSETKFPQFVLPNLGSGHYAWNSYASGKVDDGEYASVVLQKDRDSDILIFNDFGFTIPSSATITGIEVAFEVRASVANRVFVSHLKLSAPGIDNKQMGTPTMTTWPTTDTVFARGGPSDLWGATVWNPVSEINVSSFSVYFACENSVNSAVTAYLDYLAVTVFY